MNLHEQMRVNTLEENEEMMDDFIQTRNATHEEMEKLNDQWIYNLQMRKDIKTINENIEIVKAYIYKIL